MTTRPLLNADLGEDPCERARDEALAQVVDVLNVACGGHAGDTESMAHFASLAAKGGKILAAHPSYPDRANFGRVRVSLSAAALSASLEAQLAALRAAAGPTPIAWIKPHGALYHAVMLDEASALALLSAAKAVAPEASLVTQAGPPGDRFTDLCRRRNVAVVREAFADRRLDHLGRLLPRGDARALITDLREAASHVLELRRTLEFHTLCVHADTPGAMMIAREARRALDA